jgi:hypothetical protein
MPSPTRRCPDCGLDKDLDEFPVSARRRDLRGTYCRPCMNVRSQRSIYKTRAAAGNPVTPRVVCPPGHKRCPDCGLILPVDAFGKNKAARDGLTHYCQPCHNARSKASRERNGGQRRYHLQRRYGLSLEDYERMLAEQGGLCAICQERPAEHVDHCHQTGAVRGLTCFNCNGGLGQFKDRVDIMRRAISYLERTGTPQCQRVLVEPGVYRVTSQRSAAAASRSFSPQLRRISSPPV